MKAILISIRPEWVAKILNGEKTLEIRKTFPKCDLPIDVYIYCTKEKKTNKWAKRDILCSDVHDGKPTGHYQLWLFDDGIHTILNGKVVAKFTLNTVEEIPPMYKWQKDYEKHLEENACISQKDLFAYLDMHKPTRCGYAWHIDNLEIFNKPKRLSHFLIPSHKVQGIDKDGSEKTFTILKPLDRAPQSWCFVEL